MRLGFWFCMIRKRSEGGQRMGRAAEKGKQGSDGRHYKKNISHWKYLRQIYHIHIKCDIHFQNYIKNFITFQNTRIETKEIPQPGTRQIRSRKNVSSFKIISNKYTTCDCKGNFPLTASYLFVSSLSYLSIPSPLFILFYFLFRLAFGPFGYV